MRASLAVTLPTLAFLSSPPARLAALPAVTALPRGGAWPRPDHRRYHSAVAAQVCAPPPGPARRRLLDGLPPAPPPAVFVDVYYDAPGRALTVADTWLRTRDGVWQLKHPLPRAAASNGGKAGGGAPATAPAPSPAPAPAVPAAQAYVEVNGDAPAILAALGWVDGKGERGAPAVVSATEAATGEGGGDRVFSSGAIGSNGDAVAAAAARRGVVPFATIITRRVSYAFSHGGRAFRLDLDEAAFPDAPPGMAVGGAAARSAALASFATPDAAPRAATAAVPASPSSPPRAATNGEPAYVYAVGELETLVASPADVAAATADVAAAAAARGIALPASGEWGDVPPPPPRGKLATFLAATAPAHYAALVTAGVLPS
ncbi:hypothetical protein MMPV_004640 [Pyropia vietnamensis]